MAGGELGIWLQMSMKQYHIQSKPLKSLLTWKMGELIDLLLLPGLVDVWGSPGFVPLHLCVDGGMGVYVINFVSWDV